MDKLTFIERARIVYQYNDEPKFFQFFTQFTHPVKNKNESSSARTTAGTSFFSEDLALLKSIGEAIERYASNAYNSTDIIKGSYESLKKDAINPYDFNYFTQEQLKQKLFRRFNFDSSTLFGWVWVKSLTQNIEKLMPAHLIYYSYQFSKEERMIEVPVSTADNRIQFILDMIRRYRLELYIVDLTTDLMVPSFVSIVVDRSGIGQAIHVGLKAGFNVVEALIGAIEESFLARQWMRTIYEDEYEKYKSIVPEHIESHEERGMYWYPVEQIEKLNYWIRQKPKELRWPISKRKISHAAILRKFIDIFKKNKYEVYYVDITPKELQHIPFKVAKIIIPKLAPLYLTEYFPHLGTKRLYEVPVKMGYKKQVKSLNTIPNPML
ncbi:YcaO-like family protein [Candidatus Roizmanbacteria bacterium]|nr:YcaO-like family protein [Candidatus Roizmanbacteria bacterium]